MQDAHAGVVDARDAAEVRGLIADDADRLLGLCRLVCDAHGEHHDGGHDRRGNGDDHDAQHDADDPTGHAVRPSSSESARDITVAPARCLGTRALMIRSTMKRSEQVRRAEELEAAREPFVTAIVVRAQRPSSVRAGDSGLVLADGTIEGFVGGACAETSVRLHALRVLEPGATLVLLIVPGDSEGPAEEGAVTVENPCLSGGALEIFLEPRLPAPRVTVLGDTPIAHALVSLGERLGYDAGTDQLDDDLAVVVASHGRDEEDALERALRAGVPYVGLVASRRRGAAVLEELRARGPLSEEDVTRIRTPAGLDIGAQTAEEIALSILAEIVAVRRAHHTVPGAPGTAIDPVCGMEVAAAEPAPQVERDGRIVWFCSEGCRERFEADVPA